MHNSPWPLVPATLPDRYPDETPEWAHRSRLLDRGALDRDALFADFQPLVARLVRQYGEDAEHREDLRGEIYCRFCELLAAYDPARGVPLRPYLVRMLTASVYTSSRAGWRRKTREVSLETEYAQAVVAKVEDPSAAWDQALVNQELLGRLPALIGKLPLRQRLVVVGRYYESRSFEE